MTAEVIDLDEHRPGWMAGLGACGSCGIVWIGVAHVDRVSKLECPGCSEMSGVFVPDTILIAGGVAAFRVEFPERFHGDAKPAV